MERPVPLVWRPIVAPRDARESVGASRMWWTQVGRGERAGFVRLGEEANGVAVAGTRLSPGAECRIGAVRCVLRLRQSRRRRSALTGLNAPGTRLPAVCRRSKWRGESGRSTKARRVALRARKNRVALGCLLMLSNIQASLAFAACKILVHCVRSRLASSPGPHSPTRIYPQPTRRPSAS